MKVCYFLAGDIGGTNSRLGLYTSDETIPQQLVYENYLNENVLRLPVVAEDGERLPEEAAFEQQILLPFLKFCWTKSSKAESLAPIHDSYIIACLAVAGPVRQNKVQISRRKHLVISGDDIVQRNSDSKNPFLAAIKECKVMNDFVAQGYGCLMLDNASDDDVVQLVHGSSTKVDATGPIVCIGAGTGLGTCVLIPSVPGGSSSTSRNKKNYVCFPSEYGHTEWAPRTEEDVELWQYLKTELKSPLRVNLEEVVSGTGISNCYNFFAQKYNDEINNKVHKKFGEEKIVKAKVVAENVLHCKVCKMTMSTVLR